MNTKTQALTVHAPSDESRGSVVALRDRVGPLGRVIAGIAISSAASRALRDVEADRIAAEAKIARTAIALATTKICSTLVARSMPAIGSLTASLNCATSAVDASLTSSCAADVAGHLANRFENRRALMELQGAGHLDTDETRVIVQQMEEDLVTDIDRARARMVLAKDAVSQLHGYALSGIKSAERDIEKLA
jgi:hypothetical protein